MPIDPEVLYLQLGRLVVSMPEPRGNAPITPEINQWQWLGRAVALVEASGADKADIITLRVCAQGLDSSIRNQNAQTVATIVHSALARAEKKPQRAPKVPSSLRGTPSLHSRQWARCWQEQNPIS